MWRFFARPWFPVFDQLKKESETIVYGIGFDPKFSDRIFVVFQRLHGRGEYEGNGIGLAICRKIAERHKGSIRAEGRPGQGSRFTITLPLPHVTKPQLCTC